jgi:hypothetical protein
LARLLCAVYFEPSLAPSPIMNVATATYIAFFGTQLLPYKSNYSIKMGNGNAGLCLPGSGLSFARSANLIHQFLRKILMR